MAYAAYFKDVEALASTTPEARERQARQAQEFHAYVPVAQARELRDFPYGRGEFGQRRGLHGDD